MLEARRGTANVSRNSSRRTDEHAWWLTPHEGIPRPQLQPGPEDRTDSAPGEVAALVGHRIGRYVVTGFVTAGPTSALFEGTDERGKRVAIKVRGKGELVPHSPVGGVKHPALVRLLDSGELPGGQSYSVMESVPGRTLRERLDELGALPPGQAVAVLRPVARAIEALSAAGVQHGWVRPDHVIVTDLSGSPPRFVDLEISARTRVTSSAARGRAKGGLRYQAYGLSILAFELMAGEPPFDAATIRGGISSPPPFLSTVSHRLFSVPVEQAIAKCLSLEPGDRPATPMEVVHRLEEALQH